MDDPFAELDGASDDPVCAVGADEVPSSHLDAGRARDHAILVERDLRDPHAVPEVRAARYRLLDEVDVESTTLRHPHHRRARAPVHAPSVADANDEAVDVALDDGRDIARRVAQRPSGEPASTRLVTREAGPVEEEHVRAGSCEMDRRRGSGRAGSDHDCVEPLHLEIVCPLTDALLPETSPL